MRFLHYNVLFIRFSSIGEAQARAASAGCFNQHIFFGERKNTEWRCISIYMKVNWKLST